MDRNTYFTFDLLLPHVCMCTCVCVCVNGMYMYTGSHRMAMKDGLLPHAPGTGKWKQGEWAGQIQDRTLF